MTLITQDNEQLRKTEVETVALPKEYAVEFENVSRLYRLHHEAKLTLQDRVVNLFKKNNTYEDFWALKNVSFKLEKGKTLGIIGKNGAGKSTLLKLATRILEPTSGAIRVNGRVSAMLELGTGFHPELSARDNIYLNGAFYGFSRKDMDERYERIVEFSELGKFIDTPVKHFSSGMYMRLGFAVAITVSPDILIVDEVLAVGDAAFGRKCHRAIEDLKRESKAMIFVSHSAGEVSRFCDEVIYLSKGEIVAQGKPGEILDEYMMDSMGPSYFTSKLVTKAEPVKQVEAIAPAKPANKPGQPAPAPVSPVVPPVEKAPGLTPAPTRQFNPNHNYQTSPGIIQRHLNSHWQFNLPEEASQSQDKSSPLLEIYLSILNPNTTPTSFELTGYKQSGNLFDQVAGKLRVVDMGNYEVGPCQTLLLKLEVGALLRTNLLNLEANQRLAAELVIYGPGQRFIQPAPSALPQPGLFRFFPFCDIRSDNECYFEVFNPRKEPAEIFLTLYRDWAAPVERIKTFHCDPHSQLTIDLREELAGGEGERSHGERFYGGVLLGSNQHLVIERRSWQTTSPHYHLDESQTPR